MSSNRQKTQRSMWKSHKIRKIELLFLVLSFMSVPACASEKCLYAKADPVSVAGSVAQVQKGESTSYLLKDGSFLRLTTWDCSRFGRRLALTIPEDGENAEMVARLVLPLVSEDVRGWLGQEIKRSASRENYESEGELQAYESAKFSVTRDVYLSTYVIEYFTSD